MLDRVDWTQLAILGTLFSCDFFVRNRNPLRAALKIFEIQDEKDISQKQIEWVHKCKKKQYQIGLKQGKDEKQIKFFEEKLKILQESYDHLNKHLKIQKEKLQMKEGSDQ